MFSRIRLLVEFVLSNRFGLCSGLMAVNRNRAPEFELEQFVKQG